jgi:hypothetical protein
MNPLPLKLPHGAEIAFNSLYASKQPSSLVQDVLFISLPNEVFIDVGWYPEHDPLGSYRICVYQGAWDNQLLPDPIRTSDAYRVADEVSRLAREHSPTIFTNQVVTELPWQHEESARVVSGSTTRYGRMRGEPQHA